MLHYGMSTGAANTLQTRRLMKKGKINLLSFEDNELEEESTIEIQRKTSSSQIKKQPTATSAVNRQQERPAFDLSQIKDRVSRMELDEEMVLEGDAAAAFFNGDNCEDGDNDDNFLLEKIKEAKLKRNSNKEKCSKEEEEESLPDYIPITTKSDYWLTRDTLESEEAFNSSRFVREDLFNEVEVVDPANAYTNFMATSDGRKGLMMTKKILERDLHTDNYDLELEIDPEAVETEEDLMWQRGQVLKGIERGWNHPENEANFYSKQARLPVFIPPTPPLSSNFDLNVVDCCGLQENIERITRDSRKLEERIKGIRVEIDRLNSNIQESTDLETFFMRYSRFLSVKLPELSEIARDADKRRWEHFFDDVDVEDSDLLDLPDILKKAHRHYNNNELSINNLKEITELFIKYHFLSIDFDPDCDIKDVWERSGLEFALSPHEEDLELLLKEIYCYEDGEKYEKIKEGIKAIKNNR